MTSQTDFSSFHIFLDVAHCLQNAFDGNYHSQHSECNSNKKRKGNIALIAVAAEWKRKNCDATDYSRRSDCDAMMCGVWVVCRSWENEFSHQVLVFVCSVLISYAATKRFRWWLEVHLGVVQLMLTGKHTSVSLKQTPIRRQKKLLPIKNYASWKGFEVSGTSDGPLAYTTVYWCKDVPPKRSHFQLIKMRIVVKGKCMPCIECEECE